MNFFEHQELARKKTGLLTGLLIVATAFIVLSVNAVIFLFFYQVKPPSFNLLNWWLGKPAIYTSLITIAVILWGSLCRFYQLKSGGEAVARMAGATAVDLSDQSLAIRKYINVVEEMAIASGVPVPQAYIMEDESSINAFVAGYEPGESIVAVTRGALDTLNRDELQGVIGHEFSHILNGDTRINLRLISLLAGITAIGKIGRFMVLSGSPKRRSFGLDRSHRVGSSRRDGTVVIAGLLLIIIGYIGVLCGRMIKSAVSRQREFLADASAVQFTRNTDGIATALFKIGMLPQTSLLTSTIHAEELSHLCFSESVSISFKTLMASHPPVVDRIQALDKGLLPRLRSRAKTGKIRLTDTSINQSAISAPSMENSLIDEQILSLAGSEITPERPVDHAPPPPPKDAEPKEKNLRSAIIKTVGTASEDNLDHAKKLLARVPDDVRQALRTLDGATYCIESLILAGQKGKTGEIPAPHRENPTIRPLLTWMKTLPRELQFPVIELCLPVLKSQPRSFRLKFLQTLTGHARSDGKISLFEFLLLTFLDRHIGKKSSAPVTTRYRSLSAVQAELVILVRVLVQASSSDSNERKRLFCQAGNTLWNNRGISNSDLFTGMEHISIQEFNRAINRIKQLSPLLKQPVLETCTDIVMADRKVTSREYEVLRVLADSLDCPLPPLTPQQSTRFS
ncbi:MAG: peptidase M48 [Proteobacteria bacterium]|nr:MAG: peptidase M48 [Pseudomonadota bacterium]PIE40199.1 MAG: peptidase M48 [Gammaproteobacteria bacterium]